MKNYAKLSTNRKIKFRKYFDQTGTSYYDYDSHTYRFKLIFFFLFFSVLSRNYLFEHYLFRNIEREIKDKKKPL